MKEVAAHLALAALLLSTNTLSAASLPVAEDTSSIRGKLTTATNKATSLNVDSSRKAYVFFDLTELPPGARIRYARLRLYMPSVARAGAGLSLYKVTGSWSEDALGPEPAVDPAPLATFPPAFVRAKRFLSVDVTESVRAWLAAPATNEGFAVGATPGATTKLTASMMIGAKEGSGSGYPAELEVELIANSIPSELLEPDLVLGGTTTGSFNGTFAGNGSGITSLGAANLTGQITSAQIANGAVGAVQIANSAVGSNHLASGLSLSGTTSGTFSGSFVGTGVGITALPAASVTGQLSTAQIADGALTSSKLEPNLILNGTTTGAFAGTFTGNGAGLTGLVAANVTGQLTSAQISPASVGSGHLTPDLALGGTTSGTFAGVFGGSFVGNGSGVFGVPTSGLSGQVVTAQIADGAITAGQVAVGAIGSAQIANGAVNSARLAPNLVLGGTTVGVFSGAFAGDGNGITSLPAASITGQIGGSQISNGAVGSAQLAGNLSLSGTTNGTFSGDGSRLTDITLPSGAAAAFPFAEDKSTDWIPTEHGTADIQYLKRFYEGYGLNEVFGIKGLSGRLFLFGGEYPGGTLVTSLYEYQQATDQFTPLAVIGNNTNNGTSWCEGDDGDSFYFFGGGGSGTVIRYRVSTNSVQTLSSPMPVAKVFAYANRVGNKIYVSGGMATQGTVSTTIHYLNLTNLTWTQVADAPEGVLGEGMQGYRDSCTIGSVIYYPTRIDSSAKTLTYDSAIDQWNWIDAHLVGYLVSYGGEVWNLNEGFRYNPVNKVGTRIGALPSVFIAAEVGGFLYGASEAHPNAQRFFRVPISSIKRIWVKR